jgi:hypothetical protein
MSEVKNVEKATLSERGAALIHNRWSVIVAQWPAPKSLQAEHRWLTGLSEFAVAIRILTVNTVSVPIHGLLFQLHNDRMLVPGITSVGQDALLSKVVLPLLTRKEPIARSNHARWILRAAQRIDLCEMVTRDDAVE